MNKKLSLGIIQHSPIYLDASRSLEKLLALITSAAEKGAQIIVAGESWLSGYPAWLDYCPEAALWGHAPTKKVFAKMYQNSICIPGRETEVLGNLARKYQICIVLGANERVSQAAGNGTIYNSLIMIGPNGKLLNHHRKLMPTFTEKLLYGLGDAQGLKTVTTHAVQMGGLICWEHWMPLARQTLHNEGEHIHIALWPSVHEMHQIASRHYAFEGRCFVIAVGQLMRVSDVPDELHLPEALQQTPDQLLLKGGSCIIGPDGQFELKPQWKEEGIFIHEIDPQRVYEERMTLDTSGHYQRPDIFRLRVKKERDH